MGASDIFRLLLLAAIWGGSFVFLRVVAPAFGPIVTADLRVLIAWGALTIYLRHVDIDVNWRRFWQQYLVIGTFNAALPFFLFAFAALHIPASYSAILNATSPVFGALFAAIWLGEKFTALKSLGFLLGIAGVGLVTGVAPRCRGKFKPVGDGRLSAGGSKLWICQCVCQEICRCGEFARNCRRQPINGRAVTAATRARDAAARTGNAFRRSKHDPIRVIEQWRGVFVVFPLNRRYWPNEGIDSDLFDAGFHDDLGRPVY